MLKTFSIGGVHPHENKLSAHQPIVKAEIPAKAVILLDLAGDKYRYFMVFESKEVEGAITLKTLLQYLNDL